MRAALRVDPRHVRGFEDLGIKDIVLKSLPKHFSEPWPIQKKMLALNSSGLSLLARSLPSTGKSTAAMLGMLSTPRESDSHITNLVLVPTASLADQYYEAMTKMVGNDHHLQVLYRHGKDEIEADESQHAQLMSKSRNSLAPHTLIATPNRVLDYLSFDPGILQLSRLRQLVIDELDVFRHSNPEKKTTLEVLLEHIYATNVTDAPLTTLMTSDMTTKSLEFAVLPQLLDRQAAKRFIYDVSETPREPWDGQLRIVDKNGHEIHTGLEAILAGKSNSRNRAPDSETLAQVVRRLWQGEGLIVSPDDSSPMQLQEHLTDLKAPVVRSGEVAGLNLDDLSVMYVLGVRRESEINKLKWMLRGDRKVLLIALI